jgi:hypothetical protein
MADMMHYNKLKHYTFDRDTLLKLAELELELAIAEAHERTARITQESRPKEVISSRKPEVLWVNAPPWAQYHAFDGDGCGYWFENYPKIDFHRWIDPTQGKSQSSDFYLPLGNDWRWSLVERIN